MAQWPLLTQRPEVHLLPPVTLHSCCCSLKPPLNNHSLHPLLPSNYQHLLLLLRLLRRPVAAGQILRCVVKLVSNGIFVKLSPQINAVQLWIGRRMRTLPILYYCSSCCSTAPHSFSLISNHNERVSLPFRRLSSPSVVLLLGNIERSLPILINMQIPHYKTVTSRPKSVASSFARPPTSLPQSCIRIDSSGCCWLLGFRKTRIECGMARLDNSWGRAFLSLFVVV